MAWIKIEDRLPATTGTYKTKWSTGSEQQSEFAYNTFFCLVTYWWEDSEDDHEPTIAELKATLSLIRPLAFADHSSVEYNMEEIRKILNKLNTLNTKNK